MELPGSEQAFCPRPELALPEADCEAEQMDVGILTMTPNHALLRTAAPLFTSNRFMKFKSLLSAQRQPRRLSLSLGR